MGVSGVPDIRESGPTGYPGYLRDIRDIRNQDQGWGYQVLSLISLIQHRWLVPAWRRCAPNDVESQEPMRCGAWRAPSLSASGEPQVGGRRTPHGARPPRSRGACASSWRCLAPMCSGAAPAQPRELGAWHRADLSGFNLTRSALPGTGGLSEGRVRLLAWHGRSA